MTREEAIKYLKEMKDGCNDTFHKVRYVTKEETLDMAIKALEQEPILDKIRAEIKALTSNRGFLSCSVDHIHEEIDAVFDKYKAEMEAEDGNDD